MTLQTKIGIIKKGTKKEQKRNREKNQDPQIMHIFEGHTARSSTRASANPTVFIPAATALAKLNTIPTAPPNSGPLENKFHGKINFKPIFL
jgi:hypothetical protein